MTTVQIQKIANRTTTKGDPYQNGDAIVDGVPMGFVAWQHPQANQLQANTTFQVELDGRNALTENRNGKTQLVIRKDAPLQIIGIATPAVAPAPQMAAPAPAVVAPAPVTNLVAQPQAVAPAPAPAPQGGGTASEGIIQRNAALNKLHYEALVAQGFSPEQAILITAYQCPADMVAKCWFGTDPAKTI